MILIPEQLYVCQYPGKVRLIKSDGESFFPPSLTHSPSILDTLSKHKSIIYHDKGVRLSPHHTFYMYHDNISTDFAHHILQSDMHLFIFVTILCAVFFVFL